MSARRTAPPSAPGPLRDQRVVVPIMTVATVFIVIVDGAITTVALPAIARQFRLAAAGLAGVVVVYPVCLAAVIPASAWLVERYGGRRVMLLSLASFTLASGLCGAAHSLAELVAFRGLQGLAAGLLMPAAQGLMFRTFTQREQIRLSRYMIIPQQVAPAVAPLLGGLLVVTVGWRWVFLVNVPLGAVAVGFGLLYLGEHRYGGAPRLDVPGLLLSAAALSSLMYGLCAGPDQGWTATSVVSALTAGTVLLAIAVRHQLSARQPALRLRLFTDRTFRVSCLVNFIGLISTLGTMFLVPLFVQQAQGHDAVASGTTTCVEAVGVLLTVQLVGVLYQRVGPGPIIGFGLLAVAAVELLLATSDTHTGLWTLRLAMFLLGLAMGAFFIPVTISSVATLDRADSAHAATLSSVVRQAGSALAPATVTTAIVLGSGHQAAGAAPPITAYQHTFLTLAGIAVLAGLLAFRLGRGHATPEPGALSREESQSHPSTVPQPAL